MNRKANLHDVFNDGEVIVQKQRCASARVLASPEGITAKISPVKLLAKTALFKGLGKCSRVAASRRSGDPVALAAGTDHSSSSDDDDENDADISTFIRPQKRATTAVAKAERAAVSHTHGSSNKLPATTAAVVVAVPGVNLESKVMTKAKNFIMDSEMKNFDPAEWKNGRELNKSVCTEQFSVVLNSENDVSLPLPLKTAEKALLSPLIRKSNTRNGNQNENQSISDDDSESKNEDTCRLNISICDAEKISAKHASASAFGQNKKRAAADMEESEIVFNNKPQENIKITKSPMNDLIRKKGYTDTAEKDAIIAQLNDENNQKKLKKVSFAGNYESDKKILSSCNKENEPREKMKKIEKEKNNKNNNNNNINNNNNKSNNDTNNYDSEIVTVILNSVRYTRLNVLGKGGSSCVYRVLSQSDSQLYAYKRVEVKGCAEDSEAMFDSYVNEIDLLRRLKGSSPYIIELVDAEINREELYIAIIMEAGDIDLSKVLSQKQTQPSYFHQSSNQNANQNSNQIGNQNLPHPPRLSHTSSNSHSSNNNNNNNNSSNCDGNARLAHAPTSTSTSDNRGVLNPFFVRLMWLEMLEAVDHIHANRIVHGDLKPANFVFVKGHLKLIDFGIAKAFSNDTTNIYRQSQIGTVNYMAPEAIAPYCMDPGSDSRSGDRGGGDGEGDDHEGMSMRLGRASDIWSLGCILYQMIYGRPPFAALTTIQKLRAIPDDKYVIQYPSESEFSVDRDAVGTIQACLQRDPRKRALIKGEHGLLSMPFLSIDAMQHSRIRNKDKSENKDENKSQEILQDKNSDNCISVSKDKVKNAMSFAMKYFKRKSKEHSSEQEEQFLLEKVWERLCGREEGEGNDLMIDEKSSDCLERVRVESLCDRRKENDRRQENADKNDDSDGDESVGADAVAVKLSQRPRVVPTLPTSHHLCHPTPPLPQPLSSSQPLQLPLQLSSRIQTLPQKNEKDSRIPSSLKLSTGVSKDTGAVRSTSSSNGSPAPTDTVSGSISGTVTGTGSGTGTGTRQSTRLALVDAAAAIARRRAATVTVLVDKEHSQTPSSSQHHQQEQHQEREQQRSQREQQQQQQRPLRQPLRTLPFHQEQSTTHHNITEFRVQSPDKHDPKSVLEKRIGAMRKFLDDEMPADDTGTLDFMDGISFF